MLPAMIPRALRRELRRWRRRLRTLLWLGAVLGVAWWLDRRGMIPRPEILGGGDEREVSTQGPYDRDDWPHWSDVDGDCQDTRQEVLIAESEVPVEFRSAERCKVASGRWRCPYTGRVITDPRKLDVDHLVPLHEAHRSGGGAWGRDRKERYANDLGDPHHLVAVERGANRAKGDKGPDAWMPEAPGFRCEYLRQWVGVKERWGLGRDDTERRYVEGSLAACEQGRTPKLPAH